MEKFIEKNAIRRFTRQPDNSLHLEEYDMKQVRAYGVVDFKCEVFKVLEGEEPASLGRRWWYVQDYDGQTVMKENSLPDDWQPASADRLWAIARKQSPEPEPVTNNIVTAMISAEIDPLMDNVLTTGGGLVTDEDIAPEGDEPHSYEAACVIAVIRELEEKLGVMLDTEDVDYVHVRYDPEQGRYNHVYAVTPSYESALLATHLPHADAATEAGVRAIIGAVLKAKPAARPAE